jgi:hypothetical protein
LAVAIADARVDQPSYGASSRSAVRGDARECVGERREEVIDFATHCRTAKKEKAGRGAVARVFEVIGGESPHWCDEDAEAPLPG